MGHFAGKTVLVTGASRGIGAAVAKAFAAEGALVIINYVRSEESALAVEAECRRLGGDGWALRADVTNESAVREMVDRVFAETGRLDAVVNNAFPPYAFDPERRQRAWETDWSAIERQLNGSLRSAVHVCHAAIPYMKRRGGGSIVNLTTNLVSAPIVPYHDYTTAKAALAAYTRNLAADLGAFGITVNNVAPGLVYPTSASASTKQEVRDAVQGQTPLGRIATPDDIAGPVLFLASDWSRFMTGQTLYVDGGMSMRA
ncbi:SDR family oxidoreductase [Paenibacillus sp. TRM 82003]|nr:SDR family oxidoreductase [Paenibacillus sp. TRM 82003]